MTTTALAEDAYPSRPIKLIVPYAAGSIGVPPPANGSILRVVDFPPVTKEAEAIDQETLLKEMGAGHHSHAGAQTRHAFMHRTKSVDYAIVLQGEIDMLLDDSEVHLKAGDFLVQQAAPIRSPARPACSSRRSRSAPGGCASARWSTPCRCVCWKKSACSTR